MKFGYGLLCLLCFLGVVYGAVNTTVLTKNGWVSGFSSATHKLWYGLPYALPPTGVNRWQVPKPAKNWSGVRVSTSRGNACSQPDASGTSEDCLYLNIQAPINASKPLPVYVWIHGGSFWGGSGALDATFLSKSDFVFVSINYRLAALGFMMLPELMANTPENTGGFFGIQDQRAAFQWVKDNIAAFGGDPTKVTIGGQSAGAISVCTHVAAPRSAGLFIRALMESGSCNQLTVNTSGIASSRSVANKLNCTGTGTVACLYSKTAAQLIAAMSGPIWPVLHEYELSVQPIIRIKSGAYNQVGMLVGANKDDQSFQTCANYRNTDVNSYNSTMRYIYGGSLFPYVYRMYPVERYNPPVNGITAAWSDSRFKCPSFTLMQTMSSTGNPKLSYFYSFEHVSSFQSDTCLGATHSAELRYVFPGSTAQYTAEEKNLTLIMREWWSSFIVSGYPYSATARVNWTQFNNVTRSYMRIASTGYGMRQGYNGKFCDFFASPYTFFPTEAPTPAPTKQPSSPPTSKPTTKPTIKPATAKPSTAAPTRKP